MKKAFPFFIFISFLTGCIQPSEEVIQTAIFETQNSIYQTQTTEIALTPENTSTPTQIPLEDLNLSDLIFQKYDLPSGYEPSQIWQNGLAQETLVNKAINQFTQVIEKNENDYIVVSIYIFDSEYKTKNLFINLENNLKRIYWETTKDNNLGENSLIAFDIHKRRGAHLPGPTPTIQIIKVVALIFQRCNAVVQAELYTPEGEAFFIEYARNLDKRLEKYICE